MSVSYKTSIEKQNKTNKQKVEKYTEYGCICKVGVWIWQETLPLVFDKWRSRVLI